MSILSNEDILNELGKNIYVYPFVSDNIRGNTLNLTSSNMAWSIMQKESIVKVINEKRVIVIPPHDTALIETEETIYVSNKIGGTYHSRVSKVSLGLGHIGTTLDPGWIGPSLIALHNHLDIPVTINVGASIVSIIFHYLNTESTYKNTNVSGQIKVLNYQEIKLTEVERHELNAEWRSNPDKLHENMLGEVDYRKIKSQIDKANKERKNSTSFRIRNIAKSYGPPIICFAFVVFIIWAVETILFKGNHIISTTAVLVGLSGIVGTAIMTFGNDSYRRRLKE